MASRKTFLSKPSNYVFPATSYSQFQQDPTTTFEFDEADLLWNNDNNNNNSSCHPAEPKKASCRPSLKKSSRPNKSPVRSPSSLPVNIPDWSKILKEDYKGHPKWEEGDYGNFEDNEGEIIMVPPHEYLARTRGASLSVHEGIGRTLKGRDLRRVRNAIWKKVGFED